ncbi:M10 family metallopeptidase C-terminal domain-containing protein [Reyranella sp.]|uniref:M10 family metallopeptidase C-terminal domain-containing protein n=1 Tax=Reyranella sp. TaxID=1929291 RepID=UPI003D0E4875
MPTTNMNTRNNGLFDDDDTVRSSGSGVGDNDAFNNGLWNADDGFASTAISAPAGAGDPPGAPTVFGSIATLADYLVSGYWGWSGYWGTGPRHFDHSTITVNIQDLTTAEQTIAQAALQTWEDVANVTFTYTTGAADITYINDGSGSAVTSYSSVSGTTIASSTVHISSDWTGGAATGNYSYFFQTYVHETGHALGLGHQGPYNGSAVYDTDALWTNDTWRWSVMSYFAQNDYGSDTYDYVLTPQMADIFAIQSIYGAQTTTRTGDTTYGFNSNAGSFYDFSSYSGTPAFTLYDSGGTDTLDASGYSNTQTIDLTPGNWSSIGGETNNIGIYLTTIIENAFGGSGTDTIYGNDANNTLYGNGGNDTIYGFLGDDTLDGGAGIDTMFGGAGNDTYYVDDAADTTVESKNAGTDQVFSSVSYSLAGQYIENLTLTGSGNTNATGNSLANTLTGNSGNNVLNGGTGADTMAGGAGDDTYYVNATSDSVIEAANSGTDLVFSSVKYSLSGQHIENLTLTGSGNINGTGNSLANTLTGNSGNNVLNGGTGADTMAGGAGDDTYVVDNAGDTVVEASGGGTDLVQSSVSFSLSGQYIENLTLTGSGNINATGNGLANTLTGNSGKNVLDGGTGADTMAGGAGNDTYYVNGAGDSVIEASGAGTDLVFSSASYSLSGQYLENLTLIGSGNINGTGNSLANTLTGNSGNNALNGGAGADVLTGGSGDDTFVFDSALAGNIDTVADFSVANDTIQLDQSIFGAITTLGTLSASAFFAGAGAHDADDRIIYNSATGFLSYDSDGTGANAAVQFAQLAGTPTVSNTNFTVVA